MVKRKVFSPQSSAMEVPTALEQRAVKLFAGNEVNIRYKATKQVNLICPCVCCIC